MKEKELDSKEARELREARKAAANARRPKGPDYLGPKPLSATRIPGTTEKARASKHQMTLPLDTPEPPKAA